MLKEEFLYACENEEDIDKQSFLDEEVELLFPKSTIRNCTFKNCKCSNSNLNHSFFADVKFINCDFSNTDFSDSNFDGSNIKKVEFYSSKLDFLVLSLCKLEKAKFEDCSLIAATLAGSKLNGIDFRTCVIDGIIVKLEDLKGMIVTEWQALELAKLLEIEIK